jgi:hypothetical protein
MGRDGFRSQRGPRTGDGGPSVARPGFCSASEGGATFADLCGDPEALEGSKGETRAGSQGQTAGSIAVRVAKDAITPDGVVSTAA